MLCFSGFLNLPIEDLDRGRFSRGSLTFSVFLCTNIHFLTFFVESCFLFLINVLPLRLEGMLRRLVRPEKRRLGGSDGD